MPLHYIYILCDPRDGDPLRRVRYVGSTEKPQRRYVAHLAVARRIIDPGTHDFDPKARWVRELLDAGLRPIMEIISRHRPVGLHVAERRAVTRYRRLGAPLLNKIRPPRR